MAAASSGTPRLETPTSGRMYFSTHILYLEPSEESPLKKRLVKFFDTSGKIYGRNEAHLYHPHSSMTGFFKIPFEERDVLENKQKHMIAILKEAIGISLEKNQLETPILTKINLTEMSKPLLFRKDPDIGTGSNNVAKYRMQSFPTIRLEISAPWFRAAAFEFCQRIEKIGIQTRPKKVDHISLAYMHHFTIPRYVYDEIHSKNPAKIKKSILTINLPTTHQNYPTPNNNHQRLASSQSVNIGNNSPISWQSDHHSEPNAKSFHYYRSKSFKEESILLKKDPFHIFTISEDVNNSFKKSKGDNANPCDKSQPKASPTKTESGFYSFRHAESSSTLHELFSNNDNPNDPVPIPINLNGLLALAESIINPVSNYEELSESSWDIALYEEIHHSDDLQGSHQFKELFRFKKICLKTCITSSECISS